MWRKLYFVAGLLIAGFLAFILWAKVPAPDAGNTVIQSGKLASVTSPCCHDIVLLLEGDDHVYYINHGTEQDLDWTQWRSLAEGKEVSIHWIKTNWNPLNSDGSHRPVARVELADRVVFNQMPDPE